MRATEIAAKAAELVGGDRDRTHGSKKKNFENIAAMWNAWLAIRRDPAAPLDAEDVAHMMAAMKAARTQHGAFNPDDYIDGVGYTACAGEVGAAIAAEKDTRVDAKLQAMPAGDVLTIDRTPSPWWTNGVLRGTTASMDAAAVKSSGKPIPVGATIEIIPVMQAGMDPASDHAVDAAVMAFQHRPKVKPARRFKVGDYVRVTSGAREGAITRVDDNSRALCPYKVGDGVFNWYAEDEMRLVRPALRFKVGDRVWDTKFDLDDIITRVDFDDERLPYRVTGETYSRWRKESELLPLPEKPVLPTFTRGDDVFGAGLSGKVLRVDDDGMVLVKHSDGSAVSWCLPGSLVKKEPVHVPDEAAG